ncbi:MAG: SMEK domain-containing protein [bacterium]|nr:SMEK domain-containing protein [bacterium]
MLQREKYIKNITLRLSQLKSYIEMCDINGLTDINLLMEDFVCGLLNLMYGYQLVNKNHEVQNTPAYDLVDKDKRIYIQVTADHEREKIQRTIDKFIENELYSQSGRLVILLLSDKTKHRNPFDTKGIFQFDVKRDIWCFKDLARDIAKLDTEQLKRINEYVESEVCVKLEITSRESTGKRFSAKKVVCVAVAIIFLCSIAISVICNRNLNSRIGKVYFSKIQPYTAAGYYTSAEDVPFVKQTYREVKKAFSIVSGLRNEGEKDSVVEDVRMRILDLEPIEEPVLILDAAVTGNTLKFYVFNEGWGDAEDLDVLIESEVSDGYSDIGEIDMISQCTYMADRSSIKSAEVLPLAEFVIDRAKYQEVIEEFGCSCLVISLHGVYDDEIAFSWSAYLTYDNGEFGLGYGGRGEEEYHISLFAVLDVDSKPSNITFVGQDTTSIVEDALVLETVIAPTKSCVVECQNVFYINGKPQQTPVYTVKVEVPAFRDGAIGPYGSLTRELVQLSPGDRVGIERILAKYYYQAESIRNVSLDMD